MLHLSQWFCGMDHSRRPLFLGSLVTKGLLGRVCKALSQH